MRKRPRIVRISAQGGQRRSAEERMRRLAQRGRWEERWGRTLGGPLWEGCCPRAASDWLNPKDGIDPPGSEALEAQDARRGRPPEGNNPPTRARRMKPEATTKKRAGP